VANEHEEPPLRVVVVGAGAVGSFLGGTLVSPATRVTLLGRRPYGGHDPGLLRIDEPTGSRHVAVDRATTASEIDGADLVIVAVKMFDLEAALQVARGWPEAAVLTAQNGVGAEAVADSWIPYPAPLLAASLTAAVEPVPGGVRRLRTGGIGVATVRDGDAGRGTALRDRLVGAWTSGRLPAVVCADADSMKWTKLLANLVGNATSAILDMDPAAIYADARTFAVERRQLQEAVAVMRGLGLRPTGLPGADVSMLLRGLALPPVLGRPLVARGVSGARGGKSPSLRLHIRGEAAGPTEARWLNGAVVAAGGDAGVRTPVNEALYGLVEAVATDPDRAAWFAGEPGRLAEAVAAWSGAPSAVG
jgi:2-dehydropantoate 2-reductase